MRGKFYPIIFDDIFECIVAAECCKSSLSGDLFDIASDDIF